VAIVNEEERRWRVPMPQIALKCAATVLLAALTVMSAGDVQALVLAGAGTVACGALALRDLVAPVRLAADAEGLTVISGYAGHRRIPWARVTGLRIDERRRLLLHTRLLEIETEDDLHLLSAFDLGADVHDVQTELDAIRADA
jgi:hypothetical protein